MHFGPGALVAAFAAGFVSFASPCVLPLIPGYLSFVCGVGFDRLGANERRVVTSAAAFVLGFTVIFVALGAGWFGDALRTNRRSLEIAAGIFIALAGVVLLFGLLFTHALGLVRSLRRHWRVVSVGSGALLVAFGVLLATGDLVRLTTALARFSGVAISRTSSPDFSRRSARAVPPRRRPFRETIGQPSPRSAPPGYPTSCRRPRSRSRAPPPT